MSIDTVRSHTLFDAVATGYGQPAEREAALAVQEAMALLDQATTSTGSVPPSAALRCAIDDDDDIRRLQEAIPALRASAARTDERLGLDEAGESDDDE